MKKTPDILVNHDRLNNRRYLILSLYLRSDLFFSWREAFRSGKVYGTEVFHRKH